MARSSVTPDGSDFRPPGLIDSLQQLLRAVTEYFLVRLEIAGLESRGLVRKLIRVVLFLSLALVGLLTGFLYLSMSLVYVLAVKAAWGWGLAFLATAVFMLLLGALGLALTKNSLRGSWFPATLAELKKDTEWLKQNSNPNA